MYPYPQGGPPPPPRWIGPPQRDRPPGDVWIQGNQPNDLMRRLQMILSGQVQNQGFGLSNQQTFGSGGSFPGLGPSPPNFSTPPRFIGPPPRYDGGFPPPQPRFSTGVRY